MRASGNEAGDVGRIEHQQGATLVGDLAQRRGIDDAGVGGCTGHDHLRLLGVGCRRYVLEVDPLV